VIAFGRFKVVVDASSDLSHVLDTLTIGAISFGSLHFDGDTTGQLRLSESRLEG
jgi:hypothetical protein